MNYPPHEFHSVSAGQVHVHEHALLHIKSVLEITPQRSQKHGGVWEATGKVYPIARDDIVITRRTTTPSNVKKPCFLALDAYSSFIASQPTH